MGVLSIPPVKIFFLSRWKYVFSRKKNKNKNVGNDVWPKRRQEMTEVWSDKRKRSEALVRSCVIIRPRSYVHLLARKSYFISLWLFRHALRRITIHFFFIFVVISCNVSFYTFDWKNKREKKRKEWKCLMWEKEVEEKKNSSDYKRTGKGQ